MLLTDLPSPVLLVDRARLDANLDAMQARADENGVALRPHVKTHKSVEIALRQRERGAVGLTVATVGEAEVFARFGFEDLCIAKPLVGRDNLARVARLIAGKTRVTFCVDTLAGARQADAFFAEQGVVADVLLEVDTGHGRTGVRWNDPDAPAFVRDLTALSSLTLTGLLTHGGQVYGGPNEGEAKQNALRRYAAEERNRLLAFADVLGDADLLPRDATISLGSTPTLSAFENATAQHFSITEVRPGNYVFYDGQQVALGTTTLDCCALTVRATVIAQHRTPTGGEMAYLDAGKKILTTDLGWNVRDYGQILHSPHTMKLLPHARIVGLSEEHGWVRVPGATTFDVGDTVRIVPNHACVAVATQDRLYVVERTGKDGEDVVAKWTVDARGA
ncbi:MAG: alanine racemase [Bacteroidota bacterium]